MKAIALCLQGSLAWTASSVYPYFVAEHLLLADRPLNALSPFLIENQQAAGWQPAGAPDTGVLLATHMVTGWTAGAWRRAICRAFEQGYHLHIEGIGRFSIGIDGNIIFFKPTEQNQANEDAMIETLLGPALSIALAVKGVFCLHASALLAGNHVVAFLGHSGAGKSTLAAYLASNIEEWQYIADDVLPITAGTGGPVALPRFPQLKLPASQQIRANMPNRLPLGSIYLLEASTESTCPTIEKQNRHAATTTLIRHTVATSLFDDRLLASHLDLCAGIAGHIPVRRIIYPHNKEKLPEIAQMLTTDIGGTF
ncbi:MAG: hypothetical protein JXB07_09580 [Anaerolineae bacterium]|nr:hypothetical protein [Anaerolineae bacterium]